MGGVAVLQPQNLLNNRFQNNHAYNRNNLFSTAMKSQSSRNPTGLGSLNRRKRCPPKSTPTEKKTTTTPLSEKNTNIKSTTGKSSELVMGQFKILKRGEVLTTSSLSTGKVGDNLKEVKKEKEPWKVGDNLKEVKKEKEPWKVGDNLKEVKKEKEPRKVGDNLKEVKKDKEPQKVGVFTAAGLDDLVVLSSTDRLGPEPHVVPKNVRMSDFYAGSAFIISPPPSSLPVPVFFKKKDDGLVDDDCSSTNYDATSDLRRLLRLDLS